ncbi:MAG: hypothetical protein QNJ45_29385 [Ardenticatenaceae bacterium]|nr:hypothetical protein [Ardenticatenaceae bacterium]
MDSETDFSPPSWLSGYLLVLLLLLTACSTANDPTTAPQPKPALPTEALAAAAEVMKTVPSQPYPVEEQTPAAAVPTEPNAAATPTIPSAAIDESETLYVPLISSNEMPTATAVPDVPPSPTPVPTPTPIPTLDFAALRQDLQAQGQDLATAKIGFHVGGGGNRNGLGEWMQRLDEAGVPFFLKSVADAGPLFEAQNLVKTSGVPHVLVYRFSGDEYDTPNYDLPPAQAAAEHWDRHMEVWPPELDPNIVWLETVNEIDKGRSEWLGQFALETAKLAERDGFKWAAFGWSSGEPEVADWQTPSMIEFLQLAGNNPERLAIALHEYSYITSEIGHQYPYKLGRFQQLFEICDAYGIPRPTVLITEWGWEYQNIPDIDQAMTDIAWGNRLYASYPQVKGAAIWYLGPGYADIHNQTQKLIEPVTIDALTTYYTAPLPPAVAPIEPEKYQP